MQFFFIGWYPGLSAYEEERDTEWQYKFARNSSELEKFGSPLQLLIW